MNKKNTIIKVDLFIDVKPKSKINIIPPKNNIQLDDYIIKLETLDKKVKIIKETYYSSNAEIDRIQSRGLKEIFKEYLAQSIRYFKKNIKILFKSIHN